MASLNYKSGNEWKKVSGGKTGVLTFKGRAGVVSPAEGDYTAEMVGARPNTWMPNIAEVGGVNPNLLDNWYFANPVNQRGQTEYAGGGYAIDRWKALSGGALLTVGDNSITLRDTVNAVTGCIVDQVPKDMGQFVGKQFTASVLVKNVSGNWALQVGGATVGIAAAGLYEVTVDSFVDWGYAVRFFNQTPGASIEIEAVKLELGSTQTLAHQENGVWVLNEVPDYAEELRKCQRYFRRLGSNNYGQIGYGLCHIDGVIGVYPSCPTAMRIIPSVTLTGNILAVDPTISGSAAHIKLQLNGTGVNPYTPAETGVIKVNFEAVTGTVTPGRVYVVQAEGGGYVDLSADL